MNIDINKLRSLTSKEKLVLESELLGYSKLPPTIEEFVKDPYYLGLIYGNGKLYEFWIPILNKIFPDPVTTRYNNIVLTGALGVGKSTVSRIIALYLYCRLDHLKNFDIFKLAAGKDFAFSFFHTTSETAADTFTNPMKEIKSKSPYFNTGLLTKPTITHFLDTPRSKGPIGMDVLFYVFSEVNFIAPEKAKMKLDTGFNRFASRFQKVQDWFGNVIIDSSAAGSGSFVDEYIEHTCDPEKTLIVRPTQWEVKKDDFGHKGWFKVYLGDVTREPFIVNREQDKNYLLPEGLDKDKFLEVPMELWSNFRTNLELSLQDFGGISTNSTDSFIMDREKLHNAFTIPMKHPEIIEIDFYDKQARLIDLVDESLKEIPEDKVLSIGIDIGLTNDICGISIAYFDKFLIKQGKNNVKTKIPCFTVPVTIGLGRIQGQETSISLLYEFIRDINKKWEVGSVTADTFQSRQLIQDLKRDGFNAYFLSVDRTSDAYQAMKLAIYEDRLKLQDSQLLRRELKELKTLRKNGKHKVDHPDVTKADMYTNGRGSKDVSDSMCSAVAAINKDLEIFVELSRIYIRNSYTKHIGKMVVNNKQTIMKDMKKITMTGGYSKFRTQELKRNKLLANSRIGKLQTERKPKTKL